MQKFFFPFFSLCLLVFFTTCTPKIKPDLTTPRPDETLEHDKQMDQAVQNIILLIGDGMGLAQISTRYYYGGTPVFNRFHHIGLHENSPVGAKITDSAAGATAFSTGYKTYNGAIGLDGDTISRTTIAEIAHQNQKLNVLIATSSITKIVMIEKDAIS